MRTHIKAPKARKVNSYIVNNNKVISTQKESLLEDNDNLCLNKRRSDYKHTDPLSLKHSFKTSSHDKVINKNLCQKILDNQDTNKNSLEPAVNNDPNDTSKDYDDDDSSMEEEKLCVVNEIQNIVSRRCAPQLNQITHAKKDTPEKTNKEEIFLKGNETSDDSSILLSLTYNNTYLEVYDHSLELPIKNHGYYYCKKPYQKNNKTKNFSLKKQNPIKSSENLFFYTGLFTYKKYRKRLSKKKAENKISKEKKQKTKTTVFSYLNNTTALSDMFSESFKENKKSLFPVCNNKRGIKAF